MKRLGDQTLYEILEVAEDAPDAEIRAACDRAREIYGPGSLATYTLMTPEEAELIARRIDEARATLLDPAARARYDEGLRAPPQAVAATASASPTPAPHALPPVIPALRPPGPPRAEASLAAAPPGPSAAEPPREPEPPRAGPAILLARAVAAGAPEEAEDEREGPAPRPILLEREVREPPPLPAPAAAPAAAAAPQAPVPDAWSGDALRQIREARGLTVQQMADRTKVTRHHIENIEAERFGALPAPVYLRGILLSIARELRLDGQKVARAYLERCGTAAPPKR